MKSPFRKYLFTCKNCGHESACQVDAYNKVKLLKIHGRPSLDQRCRICGHEAHYHFDRLYSKPRIWPVIIIWIVALSASYFGGRWLYERFGNLDSDPDGKLYVLAISTILPFALAVFSTMRITHSESRFDDVVSRLMLEELEDYKKKTGQK